MSIKCEAFAVKLWGKAFLSYMTHIKGAIGIRFIIITAVAAHQFVDDLFAPRLLSNSFTTQLFSPFCATGQIELAHTGMFLCGVFFLMHQH